MGILHYLSEKVVLFLGWKILVKSAPFYTKVLFKPVGCFSSKLVRGRRCLEGIGLIAEDHMESGRGAVAPRSSVAKTSY